MSGKRKANRPRRRSPKPAERPKLEEPCSEDCPSLCTVIEDAWVRSRSGAISGRGYHYQDMVGAWLAARMHTGELRCERITPEGLEDISCEGNEAWQVQVKSRQAHVGDFPPGIAARHVIDAWSRHTARQRIDGGARLAVVFERPIAGVTSETWGLPLADVPALSDFMNSLREFALARAITADELDQLSADTSVIVLSQGCLERETAALAAASTGLPTGSCLAIVRALRASVARHADINAGRDWANRSSLTRTQTEKICVESTELIDREALEDAIRAGLCEPVDFDTPQHDVDFYEGRSTQPGHVAAGLVVARPSPTNAIVAALDTRRSALVVGPSGIGKSALVWLAAYVARHVVWFRLLRLRESDVDPIMRLVRASGAGRFGTVGLIVDGVGVGPLAAWDALHDAVARQPGAVLLGSARSEDTFPLATLGECTVLRPKLDRELASRMYEELHQRGATSMPYWQEAYERSNELTLEYTHLLTRGQRLSDIVASQVARRIREERTAELAILAPTSLAHRFSRGLSLQRLRVALPLPDAELKSALRRLIDEHLVAIEGDEVRGLHPLRSAAIAKAIHDVPPPTTLETACLVVRTISTSHLRGFLTDALVTFGDIGDQLVEDLAASLSGGTVAPDRYSEALHGLRLADFVRSAQRWRGILTQKEVPGPQQAITVNLALMEADLPELVAPCVRAAALAIRADRKRPTPSLRSALINRLGIARIRDAFVACESQAAAINLLAALAGSEVSFGTLGAGESPLLASTANLSAAELQPLVQAATAVSATLGLELVNLAGGCEAMLDRLRAYDSHLLALELVEEGGDVILRGERLFVSDRLTPLCQGSCRLS